MMSRVPSRSCVEQMIYRLHLSSPSSQRARTSSNLLLRRFAVQTAPPLQPPQEERTRSEQQRTATSSHQYGPTLDPSQITYSQQFSPSANSVVEQSLVRGQGPTTGTKRHNDAQGKGGRKGKPKPKEKNRRHSTKQTTPYPIREKRGYNRAKADQTFSPSPTQPPSGRISGPLPCGDHLDPHGTILPTSCWLEVRGILPICSLDSMLQTFQKLLDIEREKGIVDLDAIWDPVEQPTVPLLELDQEDQAQGQQPRHTWVQAAHLILSPFGRPAGWHLKFQNRSIVNAVLSYAQDHQVYDAWKPIQVSEAIPPSTSPKPENSHKDSVALKTRTTSNTTPIVGPELVVDDSMIRVENCPSTLTADTLTLMMSRYDLTPVGPTVSKWKGVTGDGKEAPLMFVVHFADPSWARAAIRDLQATTVEGTILTLAQYPRQIRVSES